MTTNYAIGTVAMLSGNDGEEEREFFAFKIRKDLWEHVVIDASGKAITAGWTDPPRVRPLLVVDPEDEALTGELWHAAKDTPRKFREHIAALVTPEPESPWTDGDVVQRAHENGRVDTWSRNTHYGTPLAETRWEAPGYLFPVFHTDEEITQGVADGKFTILRQQSTEAES